MRRPFLGVASALALLGGISLAHGQQATERFIPVGQSPGLSSKVTYIGTVDRIDREQRTITAGGRTIRITPRTKIWLDRTKLRLTNQVGRLADLQEGQKVEIKYEDPDRRQVAVWIKVEIARP